MRKLRNTALLIVLGASIACAQGPRGHHPKGDMMKKQIERLDSIVDLTDDQKVEIQSLQDAMKIKMKDARETKDREAMKTLRKQHKADIEAVLTEEQKTLLKESREAHRAEMKEMREEVKKYKDENVKPTLKTKRATFDSELTEDEKNTIANLKTELKAQRKAHKDANKEGHKARMTKEERQALKEKMSTALDPIVAAHKTELEKVEADLKPLKATWEADIKEIKSKHNADCEGKCAKKGKQKHKHHRATNSGSDSSMKYYKFLLMSFE